MSKLDDLNATLLRIEEKLASSGGVSSVEIKTSTRGVDVTCKAYVGSNITAAGDAAMDEFMRVAQEVTRRLKVEA